MYPRAASTSKIFNSNLPSSIKINWPFLTSLAMLYVPVESVTLNLVALPIMFSLVYTSTVLPAVTVTVSGSNLFTRISGPFVSNMIAILRCNLLATSRRTLILTICSAWSPWLKFKRTHVTPDLIIASMFSYAFFLDSAFFGSLNISMFHNFWVIAGPSVATILVRL